MSNPIPRRLLTHTAILYPYTGVLNGADQFGAAVTLEHVYVEPLKQNGLTSLGETKNDIFTLYFDAYNSVPSGQTFKAKDKITYDGLTCRVRKSAPIKPATENRIHHWEVSLT